MPAIDRLEVIDVEDQHAARMRRRRVSHFFHRPRVKGAVDETPRQTVHFGKTDRYVDGIPADSRAAEHSSLSPDLISADAMAHVRALNEIAAARGQSLAQMALAWALRDERMTSLVIGASSASQLEQNLGALDNLVFTDTDLAAIDSHAVDSGIDLWEHFRRGGTN